MPLITVLIQIGCLIAGIILGGFEAQPGQGLLMASFLLYGWNLGWWIYGELRGGNDVR